MNAGLQPKTFETFILMVKPLKTFIWDEKTFIFKKSCFSHEINSESVMLS